MRHLLVGYVDQAGFDERSHGWEPDDEFADTEATIEASTQWLVNNRDGIVEVIEFRGSVGDVVALVTRSGVEKIRVSPREPKKRGRLNRWMETAVGSAIIGLAFVAAGVVMILNPEALSRPGMPHGVTRAIGLMTVGFFGAVMLARLVTTLRKRIHAE